MSKARWWNEDREWVVAARLASAYPYRQSRDVRREILDRDRGNGHTVLREAGRLARVRDQRPRYSLSSSRTGGAGGDPPRASSPLDRPWSVDRARRGSTPAPCRTRADRRASKTAHLQSGGQACRGAGEAGRRTMPIGTRRHDRVGLLPTVMRAARQITVRRPFALTHPAPWTRRHALAGTARTVRMNWGRLR